MARKEVKTLRKAYSEPELNPIGQGFRLNPVGQGFSAGFLEANSSEAALIGTTHNLLMLCRSGRAPWGWAKARWN